MKRGCGSTAGSRRIIRRSPSGICRSCFAPDRWRVDGGRAKTNTRLSPGQRVRVPPLEKSVKSAEKSPEDISAPNVLKEKSARAQLDDATFLKSITLYDDKEVMVLNKPMGLAVQGGSGTVRHVDGMLEALRTRDGVKPRLVHRIDKDTSGILLIAKTRLAAATLAKTFRSRSARKTYWRWSPGFRK